MKIEYKITISHNNNDLVSEVVWATNAGEAAGIAAAKAEKMSQRPLRCESRIVDWQKYHDSAYTWSSSCYVYDDVSQFGGSVVTRDPRENEVSLELFHAARSAGIEGAK